MTTAKPVPPVTTVGVIGLGDIGRGVADAVRRAGLDLGVCDLRAEVTAPFAPSAHVAATPAALAARMAHLLDLDLSRIQRWLFARAVEASPYWTGMAGLARTLRSSLT